MRYAVRGGFPCKFWKKKDARFILRPLFSSISSVSTHPRATEWNWSDNGNDGNDNEDDDSRDWLKEEKKFTKIFFEFFFSNLGRSDRLLVDKLEKCQKKIFLKFFFFENLCWSTATTATMTTATMTTTTPTIIQCDQSGSAATSNFSWKSFSHCYVNIDVTLLTLNCESELRIVNLKWYQSYKKR